METWETIALAVLVVVITFLYFKYRTPAPKPDDKLNKPKSGGEKAVSSGGNQIAIYFGSQSGTAQTFAYELQTEAKAHGFSAKVVDLEGYDAESLAEEKFVVFLMATFGEGEPTDNAAQFYEWIMSSDRDAHLLTSTTFAVFALGNRQYEHFCAIGINVDKRLEAIGGQRLLDHGEGDDDGSMEDDYSSWKARFWEATHAHFGTKDSGAKEQKFQPSFLLSWKDHATNGTNGTHANGTNGTHMMNGSSANGTNHTHSNGNGTQHHANGIITTNHDTNEVKQPEHKLLTDAKYNTHRIPVIANRELRPHYDEHSSTRHIELDISKTPLKYMTADNLGIYPRNEHKMVAKMAERLGVKLDAMFTLKKVDESSKKPLPFPSTCTVRDALLWYTDFSALVRQHQLKQIAQYATNEGEKKELLFYASAEGKDKFNREQWSYFELFHKFGSLQVPFDHFLDWVPKLTPRFYTISSSAKATPNTISITVSLAVTDNKPDGRKHLGVCSSYLLGVRPGKDELWAFVRSSSFRLPRTNVPLIMVGPGTGIAPFRAFVQEAMHLKAKEVKEEFRMGPITLFFGCRHEKKDYIYKEELEKAVEHKLIVSLHTCFSRSESSKKTYVQDRMIEIGPELWLLIDQKKASFYVCGGAAMGKAVREVIRSLAEKYGKMTPEKSNDYVKKLLSSGKYIQELWS
jgi:NADPH-ferrihemoprotein reductase